MFLYATDYDGTLNCRGITPELKEAITDWRTAGNLFGVVSGRPYPSIRGQMDHDGIGVDFLVANNGAIIADGKDGILEATPFSTDTAEALIRRLIREQEELPDKKHHYFRMDAVRFYRDWYEFPDVIRVDGLLSAEGTVWPEVTEITVDYPDYETTKAAADAAEKEFGGTVCPLLPGYTSIDYIPGGVSKAAGVKRVTELLGLKAEKILATGDSLNDLTLLTDSAIEGYAVENAMPAVKEAVGRTVPDPTELIRRYL